MFSNGSTAMDLSFATEVAGAAFVSATGFGAAGGSGLFAAEVAFATRLGVRGNHPHEQRARADLAANFFVPTVAAAQLALVEPHFDAETAQRLRDAAGGVGVLACIAEEDGVGRCG